MIVTMCPRMSEKKLILILAYARTGSNYFCGLLGNTFNDINSNYEIFNKQETYINENYIEEMYKKYGNLKDKDVNIFERLGRKKGLLKVSGQNPIKYLENLIDISREPIISIKIIKDQLKDNYIKQIINKSNMIIVLDRKFIDIFISLKKIRKVIKNHLDPWVKIDTTDTQIHFDNTEYENEREEYTQWYSKINDLLKHQLNRDYIKIDYDDFHTQSLKQQQQYLKEKINNFLQYNLDIIYNITTLNKQDKSKKYSDKISNYDTFTKYFH